MTSSGVTRCPWQARGGQLGRMRGGGGGGSGGGWSNGGEPEEEVASGVVGVWEQVLGELGLVGGGAVSSGRSWWALGDAGAWLGVFKVCRGSSGGPGRENWLQVAGRMVVSLKRRWLQESWVSGSRFWVSWA